MRRGNGSLWVLLFVLFSVLISVLTALTASAKEKTDLSAKAAVLYEPSSGRFLYSENKDARLAMASTTKIMTALVVSERLSPDSIVKIPKEAVGTEGSSAYLKEDEELTVKDLLYALLLQSANDAAVALAVSTAGDVDRFALLMNEKARQLGLENTNFKNPHGLHDNEHYTTASDLARIAAAALDDPLIREISSTKRATITSNTTSRTFLNHNKLLHLYDGCIGLKTGFTKTAGRCLVGAAERGGVRLISVTLDAPSDWQDHTRLLDLGFELTENRLLASAGDFEYTLPVIGGDGESVTVALRSDVRAVLLKTDQAPAAELILPRFIVPQKNEGDTVGSVVFTLDGKTVAVGELCLRSAVLDAPKRGFFEKIKDFFKKQT